MNEEMGDPASLGVKGQESVVDRVENPVKNDKLPTLPGVPEQERALDGEGDTAMDGVEDQVDKAKGKEVEASQQAEAIEGSSTTATTGSGSASTTDPSTSSVHTTASTTS